MVQGRKIEAKEFGEPTSRGKIMSDDIKKTPEADKPIMDQVPGKDRKYVLKAIDAFASLIIERDAEINTLTSKLTELSDIAREMAEALEIQGGQEIKTMIDAREQSLTRYRKWKGQPHGQ